MMLLTHKKKGGTTRKEDDDSEVISGRCTWCLGLSLPKSMIPQREREHVLES